MVTVVELRADLKARGLDFKGKKAELIKRLANAIDDPTAAESPAASTVYCANAVDDPTPAESPAASTVPVPMQVREIPEVDVRTPPCATTESIMSSSIPVHVDQPPMPPTVDESPVFGLHELVWSKYGAHPWWPAVVTGTKGEKLKVDFGQASAVVKPGFVEDFKSGAFTC